MITAISSVKQNSNLSNNKKPKGANQVAFIGNPINLIKSEGKISKLLRKTNQPIISQAYSNFNIEDKL